MSWIVIGIFSLVVAAVLMQLFKYFVTAPELAAQDAASKRKNSAKKPQSSTPKPPKAQKSSDSSSKSQESSSQEVKKEKAAPAVSSSAQSHPQVDTPKENKPTKDNKPQKAAKEPKGQKDKLASSNESKAASSGNESAEGKKKEKGKKPEEKKPKVEKKKKASELATETTDEEFARQWAADYTPSASIKNETSSAPVATPEWRQVGSSDAQLEDIKKKLQLAEAELTTSRETNKLAHEKHQESLSRATRTLQSSEAQHKETIARLQRELDMVKGSGMGVNDTLRSKDYSKS